LIPLQASDPIEGEAFDLKTSVTTEQVRYSPALLPSSRPLPPHPVQDVLFGAQYLKAKALGLPSLREMHGHDVHLLTCSELPQGWIDAVGGMVAARSVR
jgi:hypothetical protein